MDYLYYVGLGEYTTHLIVWCWIVHTSFLYTNKMYLIYFYVLLCQTIINIEAQTTEDFCVICQCDGYVDGLIICDQYLPNTYVLNHAVKTGNHTLIVRNDFDIDEAYKTKIAHLFHNVIVERFNLMDTPPTPTKTQDTRANNMDVIDQTTIADGLKTDDGFLETSTQRQTTHKANIHTTSTTKTHNNVKSGYTKMDASIVGFVNREIA